MSEKNLNSGCDFDKHRAKDVSIIITRKQEGVMMMETSMIQDYERQRLMEYADSFRELADTFQNFKTEEENEKSVSTEGERQLILWERQLSEQRAVFAGQLQEMSRMLSRIAGQERSMEKISEKKYRQLVREMRTEGILVGDLFYIRAGDGHRQYSIQLRTLKAVNISAEDAAGLLSVLLDMRLVPHRNGQPICFRRSRPIMC